MNASRLLRWLAPLALLLAACTSAGGASVSRLRVSGDAMEPNFHDGQSVRQQPVASAELVRGDVVILEFEGNRMIKRLIGLPGETVQIQDGQVAINGEVLAEPYLTSPATYTYQVQLGEDEYLVLGDNRDHSTDSHTFGPIPGGSIVGRVIP